MPHPAPISLTTELHLLLDQAAELADETGLARLREILLYLSEGAEIKDYSVEVPQGLDHNPLFQRQLKLQQLLTSEAAGRC